MGEPTQPWNLNIHYDQLLTRLARPGDRALDVGCGDGFLAARLQELGCSVAALDADAAVLDRAQERWAGRDIEWVCSNMLTYEPPAGGFDLVVSNAAIHHLPDTRAVLTALAGLVRPGGTLGIVGFARNGPLDWPMSLLGAVGILVMNRKHHKWEHTAPISWPPPATYGQMRQISAEALPGRTYRRLWLGRYFLEWTRPVAAEPSGAGDAATSGGA